MFVGVIAQHLFSKLHESFMDKSAGGTDEFGNKWKELSDSTKARKLSSSSLRQAGVAIPDDAILEYSHLNRKEQLAQRIRVMTGQEPPSEQEALMQQAQTQMAMQTLQLEIAKLEAEVQKLQSEAAVNMAKAQGAQTQPQLEVAEMQAKLEMKNRELELRRELAALSNQTRQGQTETAAAAKLARAAMNTAVKQQEQETAAFQKVPEVKTF